MDISKLAKLLGYTTSPNDNEALNAMRMANAELDKANLTWMDFCSQKTIVVQNIIQGQMQAQGQTQVKGDATVEKMLQVCLQNVTSESGLKFIQSLSDWYLKNGKLTEKQRQALEKWFENV